VYCDIVVDLVCCKQYGGKKLTLIGEGAYILWYNMVHDCNV
jgi:hypothetical protein